MKWFKIDMCYGPGHQGHDIDYVPAYGEDPSEDEKREAFDTYVNEHPWIEDAVGDVTVLETKELPENIRNEKIKDCESNIRHYTYVLKQLRGE